MKFLILLLVSLADGAQQYFDQSFDFMYQPPMTMANKYSQPYQMPTQERSRALSGFPQNYPQAAPSYPIGHSEQPRQPAGCKNHESQPFRGQQQEPDTYQPQQPASAYIPPQQQNQYQPQPQQYQPQSQQYQPQPQQYETQPHKYQPQPQQFQYQPQPQQNLVGYSTNHQAPQAVQLPRQSRDYDIFLPQKNEIPDDYKPRQQQNLQGINDQLQKNEVHFTHTYPLTAPSLKFKIGLIADLGRESKTKNGTFISYLREGHLTVHKLSKKDKEALNDTTQSHNVTVEFIEDEGVEILESGLNDAGEGFELSTLNVFNGKLYTCDDQTGIIYELVRDPESYNMTATPWIILPSTGGKRSTFKCEWATVKENHLWIGSLGIAIEKDGSEVTDKRMVKKVSPQGEITTLDWTENYNKIAKIAQVNLTEGFVNHEAVAWSDILQKWIFIPRRLSQNKFDKATIDQTGCNLAFFANDQFEDIETKNLGELVVTQGFTSVKFIPGSQDQLLLTLKTGVTDKSKNIISILAVYDIEGNEIMKPTKVANGVYAGVEFL